MVTARILKERAPPPSTFAALFRRSKFASYDQKIAQIYTTYDGHAHRGNWGLKRPLALKRKNGGFIIVKSVDSNEQQTEWYRAEQEARWLKAFSDFGKDVVLTGEGTWMRYMGNCWQKTFDSDYNFDPTSHSKYEPDIVQETPQETPAGDTPPIDPNPNRIRSAHPPNPSALNPKEFRRLLVHLRRSRSRFKSMLDDKIEESSNSNAYRSGYAPLNKFNAYEPRFNLVFKFLNEEADQPFLDRKSKNLLPNPHYNASLSYAHISDLTNQILYKPVPGRIFTSVAPRSDSTGHQGHKMFWAGVAGMLGKLNGHDTFHLNATKLADQAGHAVPVEFRAKRIGLRHPPRVVNAPENSSGFENSNVELELVDDAKLPHNSFLPGSQVYIAHEDPSASTAKGVSKSMGSPSEKRRGSARSLLGQPNQDRKRRQQTEEMLAQDRKRIQRTEEMLANARKGTHNHSLDDY